MNSQRQNPWLVLAAIGAGAMLVAHIIVLFADGNNALTSPISALSRGDLGWLHSLALIIFGCSHVFLAVALGGLDRGRLWPYGRALLVISGASLAYVAYYFVTSSESALVGESANDPLWFVASVIGIAMGALQPGLGRLSPRVGLFSTICLGIWLWLIPLILLVNENWLGAYERIVGAVYIAWMAGVSLGLLSSQRKVTPVQAA